MNSNTRNLNLDEIYINYMEYVRNSNRILNNTVAVLFNQQQTYNNMINSFNTSRAYSNIATPIYSRNYTYRPSPLSRYNYIYNRFFVNSDTEGNTNPNNTPNVADLVNSISYRLYSDIENPTNTTCPISQRDFSNNDVVIMINRCGHLFDPQQIMTWFSRCSQCPLCRNSVLRNNIQSDNNMNVDNDENDANNEDNNDANSNDDNNDANNEANNDNDSLIYRYFSNYNRDNEQTTSNLIDQLANIISNEITRDQDFSGNIQIEFGLNGR